MNLNPETDLTFTRTLNAPRSLLWECWTTPKHIMKFLMPKPHSLDACDLDLRVGGRFNTTLNIDGNQIQNTGVFLEIVDRKRLVFTDGYSEEVTNILSVLYLEEGDYLQVTVEPHWPGTETAWSAAWGGAGNTEFWMYRIGTPPPEE